MLHYFPKSNRAGDFLKIVLHNESFTAFFKLTIIKRLGLLDNQYNGIKKDLQTIFEIRNKAAHSVPVFGSPIALVLTNSRKMKAEDLKTMYKQISELISKINPALEKVMIKVIK